MSARAKHKYLVYAKKTPDDDDLDFLQGAYETFETDVIILDCIEGNNPKDTVQLMKAEGKVFKNYIRCDVVWYKYPNLRQIGQQ